MHCAGPVSAQPVASSLLWAPSMSSPIPINVRASVCFDFHGMESKAMFENLMHEYSVLCAIPRHRNIIRYLRQFEARITPAIRALLPPVAQEVAEERVLNPDGSRGVKLRRCQFVLMDLVPCTLEAFITRANKPRLAWAEFLPLALDVVAGLRVRVHDSRVSSPAWLRHTRAIPSACTLPPSPTSRAFLAVLPLWNPQSLLPQHASLLYCVG